MNIVCAKCGAGVTYERSALADQTVVVCSTCRSGLKVRIEAFEVPDAATSPGAPPVSSARDRAVVAVQGEATRELIRDLLSSAGLEVVEVTSGSETLAKVRDTRPGVVLVDVGLSDMPGFQVCEGVRRDPANVGIKIVLVAAIHNKDRYRRPPDNLFGADDYVERHQIENELVEKVKRLLVGATPGDVAAIGKASPEPELIRPATPPDRPATSVKSPVGAGVFAAGPGATVAPEQPRMPMRESPPAVSRPTPVLSEPAVAATRAPAAPQPAPEAPAPAPATPSPGNPAQEAALRLARIIVSDIALYNAKKVDEGVLNGTFFDLLRNEIEEGRKLYEERKGPGLTTTVDLFQQTIEQFVATRRELLKRNRPAAA